MCSLSAFSPVLRQFKTSCWGLKMEILVLLEEKVWVQCIAFSRPFDVELWPWSQYSQIHSQSSQLSPCSHLWRRTSINLRVSDWTHTSPVMFLTWAGGCSIAQGPRCRRVLLALSADSSSFSICHFRTLPSLDTRLLACMFFKTDFFHLLSRYYLRSTSS